MIKELLDHDRPFLIEHLRLDESHKGFVPSARLQLTPFARTSGFLRELSGAQSRILLAVFTYLTANGHVYVTANQVAEALGVPTPLAAAWLWRFARRRFRGVPIIHVVERELGANVFTIAHPLVKHVIWPAKSEPPVIFRVAGRRAIVAHSRAKYAQSAQAVLPLVMRQLGHHHEEAPDTPEARVWEELRHLKIGREDIRALIDTFGVGRILQQLAWLPERYTKNRAKTLVASLLKDAPAPRRIRDVIQNYRVNAGNEARSELNQVTEQKGEYD